MTAAHSNLELIESRDATDTTDRIMNQVGSQNRVSAKEKRNILKRNADTQEIHPESLISINCILLGLQKRIKREDFESKQLLLHLPNVALL